MTGRAPPNSLRLFEGPAIHDPGAFSAAHKDWLSKQRSVSALIHASHNAPNIQERITFLTETGPVFAFGSLLSSDRQADHGAGQAELSGAFFGDGAEIIIGHAQSCRPIGGLRRVTNAAGNVILELDGDPALNALQKDAAPFIGGDLRRIAGRIHLAIPDPFTDEENAFQVRELEAADPMRGWLAIRGTVEKGERIAFVCHDDASGAHNLGRMAEKMKKQLGGRAIQGGLFISSSVRNAYLFGAQTAEQKIIAEHLGDFPMLGLSGTGEIRRNLLYNRSNVLALFV